MKYTVSSIWRTNNKLTGLIKMLTNRRRNFGNGGLETSLRKLEIEEIPISAKNG